MILYFSGTGNSQYVAKRIAKNINDEFISINQLLKQKTHKELKSAKPFVFVCPTYAWRIPKVVEKYIRDTCFTGSTKVYFIMTCGGESANAVQYIKKLCAAKKWQLKGFAEIRFPDNYTVLFPGSETSAAEDYILKAKPVLKRISTAIQNETDFTIAADKGFAGKLQSGIVNGLFYSLFVHAKGFHVTDEKCISCGKCIQLCPLNNVALSSGKPVWGNDCTHCMACINGCAATAIEYKNKSQGKPRYFLEKE